MRLPGGSRRGGRGSAAVGRVAAPSVPHGFKRALHGAEPVVVIGAKQLEALHEAYDTLREPLKRGRYWLTLHEKEFKQATDTHPFVKELRNELDNAAEPQQCDRVAQKAGQALEQGIMGLMQALRAQDWQQANRTLIEVDGLENILGDVRAKRAEMTIPPR